MHTHFLSETGSCSFHEFHVETEFERLIIIDMREVKSERELLPKLGVKNWLELQGKWKKIVVTHWERLQKMAKAAADALVYLATDCDSDLVTCSRYPWITFNTYSPTVVQKDICVQDSLPSNDPCLTVVRSMFKGLLGEVRTCFEHLKVHYDYETGESMQAFKKLQAHAAQYLANLGTFPLSFCTFTREERFMLYAAFIGGINASKHDALIFGSFSVKKRRINRTSTNRKSAKKKTVLVKEGRKWVGEERLLAIYFFITPVPPACFWLAKRLLTQLSEKRLLASQGGKKYKCLLGEHFLYTMASKLDAFELERYLYKV